MKIKKIIFRPSSDITEQTTPIPIPAKRDVSKWYKDLKRYINNGIDVDGSKNYFALKTGKTCIPLLDSITAGYYYRLPYDVFCSYDSNGNRTIRWGDTSNNYIDVHPTESVGDYPIPEGYEPIVFKINTTWSIQTPPGYSSLFMHPLGKFDLPFYSFHGIVDSDAFIKHMNIPIVIKAGFEGLIKQGTPISQVIPIKRESWKSEQKKFKDSDYDPAIDTIKIINSMEKWYKNNRWVKKHYD